MKLISVISIFILSSNVMAMSVVCHLETTLDKKVSLNVDSSKKCDKNDLVTTFDQMIKNDQFDYKSINVLYKKVNKIKQCLFMNRNQTKNDWTYQFKLSFEENSKDVIVKYTQMVKSSDFRGLVDEGKSLSYRLSPNEIPFNYSDFNIGIKSLNCLKI